MPNFNKKQLRSKSCGLFSVGSLQQMAYCHKISTLTSCNAC